MKKNIISIFLIFSFFILGGCLGDKFMMGKMPSGGETAPEEAPPPEGLPSEGSGGSGDTANKPDSYLAIQKITIVPQAGGETQVIDFIYQEGKLVEIKRLQPTTGTGSMVVKEEFSYDDGGRLVELKRYKGENISGAPLNERFVYEYDGQGRVKKMERYAGPNKVNTNTDEYTYEGNTCVRQAKVWDSSNEVWIEANETASISFSDSGLPIMFDLSVSTFSLVSEQGFEGQKLKESMATKLFPENPFSNRKWTSKFSYQGAVATQLTQEMTSPDNSGENSPKKCWVVRMDSFSSDTLIYKESMFEFDDSLCEGWEESDSLAGGEVREVEFEDMGERPFMPPMNLSEFTPGRTLLMADDAVLIYGKWMDSF